MRACSVSAVAPEYASVLPSQAIRSAYGGGPLAWTTSKGVAVKVPRAFLSTRDAPGKSASVVSRTRSSTPRGPTTVSGRERRRNWPARTRNGTPAKWSPWRCVRSTASTSFGSTPNRRIATSDDAPQSTSTCPRPVSTWMHVWNLPPLPNASPEPRKRTFTGHPRDGTHDIVPPMSATTRLAEFAVKTSLEDCPPAAIARTRLAALDTLGVMLAGAAEPAAPAVRQVAPVEGGAAPAAVIGTRLTTSPRSAALANGTAGPPHRFRRPDF